MPTDMKGDVVDMLTDIEQLEIEPDQVARVVIDEQNGIIVMGENVRISTVAVAQGNLTVKITETPQVSQPNAFSAAGTIAPPLVPAGPGLAPNSGAGLRPCPRPTAPSSRPPAAPRPWSCRAPNIEVNEESDHRMAVVSAGVSLQELVNNLNALGVGPRDMISILQAIKASGALQADIELM